MSAHTPGPWLIDTEDRDICVKLPDGEFLEIASVGCMDHNGVKYWFGPESWANACLLRSAPDMLAALQAVAEELGASYRKDDPVMMKVDAAITKAMGKV